MNNDEMIIHEDIHRLYVVKMIDHGKVIFIIMLIM